MSQIPEELKYLESHEWLKDEGDGIFTVGITDHAQEMLGDLVYVEAPEVGVSFNSGDECAVVESVKAASDIYSPISGEIVEINGELEDTPELVNSGPYADGWLFKIKASNPSELEGLLSAAGYADVVAAESD
ncbi:MAG: glycine cleavage system protein GcvH [Pseudomonadota bacterium]